MRLALENAPHGLHLLCLGAHADDIEIGAGGTVLVLARAGLLKTVRWVVLSATPERASEARAAARDLLETVPDVDVRVESFPESYFPAAFGEMKRYFETLKSGPNPDLIFTHRRVDLHQDHRLVGELSWNTFRNHLMLEYEIPKYDGDLGHPNVFVELPSWALDRKVEILNRRFTSQATRDWFDDETFRGLARLRGIEGRVASGFAEAFDGRKLELTIARPTS